MTGVAIIDLCVAEPFCMEPAAHLVTITVRKRSLPDLVALTRKLKVCVHHLETMKEHAEKRGREHPDLAISVAVVPLPGGSP